MVCDISFSSYFLFPKSDSVSNFLQLDCGIHPGLTGMDALPFVDLIEAHEIDLLLISQ